jgi:hypothetical protein
MPSATPHVSLRSMGHAACRTVTSLLVMLLCCPAPSSPESIPFAASSDQVLVIYNADWKTKSDGSTVQDSQEIAEYYVKMHTDPKTGKKPYILGLNCKHFGKNHLNGWAIKEESNDNANGIVFNGKGAAPTQPDWIRDSRKVEIWVTDPNTDWNSVIIRCRSQRTGEEVIITPLRTNLKVSGIPATEGDDASYPPVEAGKGRCFRFDATKLFPGTVTLTFSAKNRDGKVIRNLSLSYYDIKDFAFSSTGPDGVPDDSIVEKDVLQPVRTFLEDPANALPDGTLLKEHILYIVLVHGMPYSAKAVFGIEHGATSNRIDHGSLASLEQRLQILYYRWDLIKPPVISMFVAGGPDSDKGVVSHIITTAMRNPLGGIRWNPYMHPDTYSFLRKSTSEPVFHNLPPLQQQRKKLSGPFFAYGVTRIDGANPEEAKRIIDYSLYASRYLRPEMDCRLREELSLKGKTSITDMERRLKVAENLWGETELQALGFNVQSKEEGQGLPFMVRPSGELSGNCRQGTIDWRVAGFYPGGMERHVKSENGLNYQTATVWQHIAQGVTVSAAGAPAYSGGPHITNATFWDNRILMKYLLRGRDLGESFLRATWYVNWSTSLIGDPLYHPDLNRTIIDRTPPRPSGGLSVSSSSDRTGALIEARAGVAFSVDAPEVALLRIVARDPAGKETVALSPLYSRNPLVTLKGLAPDTEYSLSPELMDPYGNRTKLPSLTHRTPAVNVPLSIIKDFIKGIKVGK